MHKVAEKQSNNDIKPWVTPVVNHLYYVVDNSSPGHDRQTWWEATVSHICDIHDKCHHGHQLLDDDEDGEPLERATIDPSMLVNYCLNYAIWNSMM